MSMRHAIFALVLSTVYLVIGVCDHDLASSLTILFVVLVLFPELSSRAHRRHT